MFQIISALLSLNSKKPESSNHLINIRYFTTRQTAQRHHETTNRYHGFRQL